MAVTRRINTPEFIFEMAVGDHGIVRGQRDPQTGEPFILVTEEQEKVLRGGLLDQVIQSLAPAEELPAGMLQEEEVGGGIGDQVTKLTTHGLNVGEAVDLIEKQESLEALEILSKAESSHPDFPNGRRGVINALAQRREELTNQ